MRAVEAGNEERKKNPGKKDEGQGVEKGKTNRLNRGWSNNKEIRQG